VVYFLFHHVGRIIFVLLLLVAIIGAGLLYWLHQKPLSLDQYRSYVADDLSEAVGGRDVRIQNLRIGFLPGGSLPTIAADRLDVLGEGGKSLFGADNITLGIKLSELFIGRVDLSDLRLGELRLPLIQDSVSDPSIGTFQQIEQVLDGIQELVGDDIGSGLDGILLDRLVLAHRFQSGIVLDNIQVTKNTDGLSVVGNVFGGSFVIFMSGEAGGNIGVMIDGAQIQAIPYLDSQNVQGRFSFGAQLAKDSEGLSGSMSAQIVNGLYHQRPIDVLFQGQLIDNLLVIPTLRGRIEDSSMQLSGVLGLEPGEEGLLFSGDGGISAGAPLAAPLKMDLPSVRARFGFDGSITGGMEVVREDLKGFVRVNHGNEQPFIDARLENIPVAILLSHWPIIEGSNTHAWLNEHVQGGVLPSLNLSMDDIKARPRGAFVFEKLAMNFLDKQLRLAVPSGVGALEGNSLRFQLDTGQLNQFKLQESSFVIDGLYDDDQQGRIDANALGDVDGLKSLLTLPRIGALTRAEAEELNISSAVSFRTKLELPLIADLSFDDVALDVSGLGQNVIIPDGDGGSITSPGLTLGWKKDAPLSFKGPLNWQNVSFMVEGAWQDGLGINADLSCPGANSRQLFASLEIENGDDIIATDLACRINFVKPNDAPSQISGEVDFVKPTLGALGTMFLGERLPRRATFTIPEDANSWGLQLITDAEPIRVEVTKTGRQEIVRATGLSSDYISDGVLQVISQRGRSNLELSGGFLDVGRALDEGLLDGDGAINSSLRIKFEQLLMPGGLDPLIDANLSVIGDGKGATVVAGQVGKGVTLSLTLPDDGPLKLVSANGGELLRMLGIVEEAKGGRLDAIINNTSNGISGNVVLQDVHVTKMPVFLRLLSVASLQGLADGLQGRGVRFDEVRIPFEAEDGIIIILDALAKGPSIGLTIKGIAMGEEGKRILDLKGVLIPVYGVNSLIGQVPIIGNLVTGGERSGLISINYSLQGPTTDPSVSVNPVTSVIPGPIKRLFGIE